MSGERVPCSHIAIDGVLYSDAKGAVYDKFTPGTALVLVAIRNQTGEPGLHVGQTVTLSFQKHPAGGCMSRELGKAEVREVKAYTGGGKLYSLLLQMDEDGEGGGWHYALFTLDLLGLLLDA